MRGDSREGESSRTPRIDKAFLFLAAAIPFLASSPGQVSADSRQYLYLDPAGYLSRALSLWDPSIGAGTVPHQHLGFLWPMGPWFYLCDLVGLPDWVAQRLWLTTIAVIAGLGMARLVREFGIGRLPALVAAIVYQFTPYQLAFTARFSALLLPWAALPWLVLLAYRSTKDRSWRWPLAFGLVASTAGAVNGASIALVMLAPAAVLITAFVRTRDQSAVLGSTARIITATIGASAWWLSGLIVQGRYGLPLLDLTENVDTVTAASLPQDLIRGFGNWIFTSTDGVSTQIEQAALYQQSAVLRFATAALPALALGALVMVRHRLRSSIAWLLAVATVIATGAAPLGGPSAYGRVWKWFTDATSVGLTLRNTPRTGPVIVLALAMAVALALHHVHGRRRIAGAGLVVLIVAVSLAPVARHGFLAEDFQRPEDIPAYWNEIARDLDRDGTPDRGSRVLELPGSNFAAYEWGNAVEPVTPGLIDRPYLAREILPAGGSGTVSLLAALDRDLLTGTFEPDSLAPVARLLGVGDVVIRGDLDHERFGLPDPSLLIARFLDDPPAGFTVTGSYGADGEDPVLLRLSLDDPTQMLRADPSAPVLLAGDGDGIVDAAAAGILDGNRTVLMAPTATPTAIDDAVDRDGEVIVTDTNRKQATTYFYTLVDDVGATERSDTTEPDPTGYDFRFGPFSLASTYEQTVAEQVGGTVEATMAGGPEHPEDRAINAFDGRADTSWRPRAAPIGQRVTARFDETVSTDSVHIVVAPGTARPTAVRLTVDGMGLEVALDERAQQEPGQQVELPTDHLQELGVEITAVEGEGAPGLAEVTIDSSHIDEVLRMPTGLIDRIGDRVGEHRLTFVMTRRRGNMTPTRPAVEQSIDRRFDVPVSVPFELTATGPRSDADDGSCIDGLVAVDDDPVRIRWTGTDSNGASTYASCDPIELAEGDHRLRTLPDTPISIDRILLATTAQPSSSPPVAMSEQQLSTRSATALVDASDPFWFTLAQSQNDGWVAEADGGTILTESMTDGFANGWLIEPDGTGPVRVELTWQPQRTVWFGLAISFLTLVMAAFVWLRPTRERSPVAALERSRSGPIGVASSVLVAAAWTLGWWFVAGPAVAILAFAFLALRTLTTSLTPLYAAGATGAVLVAEMTDRPSGVFLGLALVLAEILNADVGLSLPGWLRRLRRRDRSSPAT